jgi:hypothetical protein
MYKRLCLIWALSLGVLNAQEAAAEIPVAPTQDMLPPAPASAKTYDAGLLEETWFGPQVPFRKNLDIDFFWVKPDFDLANHELRLQAWEPPVMLAKGRGEQDIAKAKELTYLFPILLRSDLSKALAGKAKLSSAQGDLVLQGRFVDVNAGSDNVKFFVGFGAGSATATWDLKIVDQASGELLLAIHHRCVSASAFSGIQDKLQKWSRRFAQFLSQGTLGLN